MTENVITLALNPGKLSNDGKRALTALLKECMVASNRVDLTEDPVNHATIAHSFYKYVSRYPSQKGVVDLMLDKTVATYKEVKKAAGHPNGGSPMAGVMSSITRNWQRSSGIRDSKGAIQWDDFKERYFVAPENIIALRQAREFYKNKTESID